MSSDPPSPSHDDLVGRVVGKYRIARLCGRGGMGSVFEAQNTAIGKRVALKFIDPDHAANRDSVQRFLREAQAASAVESNHIVQIFDVGETDDGLPYLVMELLRGENLGQLLRRTPTLPVRDALHIIAQTLRGLHRAHQAGIVHRDLKPENIFLVDSDDDPMFVKIVDFGISKITRRARGLQSDTITQQGVVLGTPFYMSPEQAQAMPDLDARTDLWSVGAILFECLAGRRPFPGDTYEQVIIAICTRELPDIKAIAPTVPSPLAAVIERAMSRDRSLRYQSAPEFLDALRIAAPDLSAALPSSSTPVAQPTWQSPGAAPAPSEDQPSPRTQSSWSGDQRLAPATPPSSGASPTGRRPRSMRLLAIGLASGITAFAVTVGWINRGRQQPAAAVPIVQSSVPARASVRIVPNPPNALIYVDAKLSNDGVISGDLGSAHVVRVEASGHPAVEQVLRLDGSRAEVHIDVATDTDAPSAVVPADSSTAPSTSAADGPSSAFPRIRPAAASSPGTPPHGNGLQLKTDIP